MVLLTKPDGSILSANPEACKTLGMTEDEIIQAGRAGIVVSDERWGPAIERREATGRIKTEFTFKRKDGTTFEGEVTSSLFTDADGSKKTSMFIRDITERKRAEDELRRSNVELQQFAYVASHDLQEPLRMVISYLSLLERRYLGRLDPDADEYIKFAVSGGNRMKELIDDLLEFSRIDIQGKDFVPVDMNMVVARTMDLLKIPIEKSHADIVIGPLPFVLADESQMIQVMQNLISNAIKFHGPERPKVQISAKEAKKEWTVSVKDNGIGMDMEYAERIFQMFQRLHTADKVSGTGIGLAISKKIVERHAAGYRVESEEGKGATFFFTIPKRSRKDDR